MPTQTIDPDGTYRLHEPGKAITWNPKYPAIGVHSAAPMFAEIARACEYLAGEGHCEAGYSAGADLKGRWQTGPGSHQIVWDELQRWFRAYFPEPAGQETR